MSSHNWLRRKNRTNCARHIENRAWILNFANSQFKWWAHILPLNVHVTVLIILIAFGNASDRLINCSPPKCKWCPKSSAYPNSSCVCVFVSVKWWSYNIEQADKNKASNINYTNNSNNKKLNEQPINNRFQCEFCRWANERKRKRNRKRTQKKTAKALMSLKITYAKSRSKCVFYAGTAPVPTQTLTKIEYSGKVGKRQIEICINDSWFYFFFYVMPVA